MSCSIKMLHDLKNSSHWELRWVRISQLHAGLDQSIVVGVVQLLPSSGCSRSFTNLPSNPIERLRAKNCVYLRSNDYDLRAEPFKNLVNGLIALLRVHPRRPDELSDQQSYQGEVCQKFLNLHGNTYFRG